MRVIEEVILILIILAPIRDFRPRAAYCYAIEPERLLNNRTYLQENVRKGSAAEVQQPITLRTASGSEAEVKNAQYHDSKSPESARPAHS